MSGSKIDLLFVLSRGGQRADDVAAVICRLVTDGAQLGALEPYEIVDPDAPDGVRTVRGIPRVWLDRLGRAVEVGAFDRLTVEAIVERILAPPLPAHVENETV